MAAISVLLSLLILGVVRGVSSSPPPPLVGWSSWNMLGCQHLTEDRITSQARALNATGLKDLGYTLIALDDCWQAPARNETTGLLEADPTRFPGGMQRLSDTLHTWGFKLGLYTCAGEYTCQLRPGALNHECSDAAQYAAWGVDVLKEDWCFTSGFHVPHLSPQQQYTTMRECLDKQGHRGRNVKLATCDWGVDQPWKWAGKSSGAGAIMWRTAPDMFDDYDSLCDTADMQLGLHTYAEQQGGVNDPDGLWAGGDGMSHTEYRTQFFLWSILAAPLIASNDMVTIDATTLTLLSSSEVIRINQDPLGAGGTLLHWGDDGIQIWVRTLTAGARGILFWNRNSTDSHRVPMKVAWDDLGIPPSVSACTVTDAFTRKVIPQTVGRRQLSYGTPVTAHDSTLLRMQCHGSNADVNAMDAWRPSLTPALVRLGEEKRTSAMVPWIASQDLQNLWVGFFEGCTKESPAGMEGFDECMPAILSRGIELQRGWQAFVHGWDAGTAKGARALLVLVGDVAQLALHAVTGCHIPILYERVKRLVDELSSPSTGWKELALDMLQHAPALVSLGSQAVSDWQVGVKGSSGRALGQIFMLLSQNSTLSAVRL